MKLKDLLEADLKMLVNVFNMTKEDRKLIDALIKKDDKDKMTMKEFDAEFLEICSEIDINNRYIRNDDTLVAPGTRDSIAMDIAKKKVSNDATKSMKSGDIIKIGGTGFVKLLDGKFVTLHRYK